MKPRGSKVERLRAQVAELLADNEELTSYASRCYQLVQQAEAYALRRRAWAKAWKALAKRANGATRNDPN